ncbi:MAG: hypothetical protein AB8B56_09930 [Crocinitomicaceae bacterium]
MRIQHDRFESIETDKQLIKSIVSIQNELAKYHQKNGKYDQEFNSEVKTIIVGLDLLLERILSER